MANSKIHFRTIQPIKKQRQGKGKGKFNSYVSKLPQKKIAFSFLIGLQTHFFQILL